MGRLRQVVLDIRVYYKGSMWGTIKSEISTSEEPPV